MIRPYDNFQKELLVLIFFGNSTKIKTRSFEFDYIKEWFENTIFFLLLLL